MAIAGPIGTILSVVGTVVSVLGQRQETKAQVQTQNYNAQINERDAVLAEQDAALAKQASQRDAAALERDQRLKVGQIRAAAGASGTTFEGSPLDLLSASLTQSELDISNTLYQGSLNERTHLLKAQNLRTEAGLLRTGAANTKTAGSLRAGSTLLSGVSDTAAKVATIRNLG